MGPAQAGWEIFCDSPVTSEICAGRLRRGRERRSPNKSSRDRESQLVFGDEGEQSKQNQEKAAEEIHQEKRARSFKVREEDLLQIGVKENFWLNLKVGETCTRVRYLKDVKSNAKEIKAKEIYLLHYPLYAYPRLILFNLEKDVVSKIPGKRGDFLILDKVDD